MGIAKLMDFIKKAYPQTVRNRRPGEYSGKVMAIDASNTIYQFLVKTQTITRNTISTPTDWLGNKTGHLIGILSRNLFCVQNGVSPIWVFDGRPPVQKFQELSRRKKAKEEATEKSETAIMHGDLMEALKQTQRTISVSQTEKEDAKTMLKYMGMPVLQAPGEAEAQCAYLAKSGLAYGVISEDMDTLTHGAPALVRNFNKRESIYEVNLKQLLDQMNVTMDQFIDFCILCGCDYTTKIANVGPVRGLKLLKELGNIEAILEELANKPKNDRYKPEQGFDYIKARNLFTNANVKKEGFELDWKQIDEQGLRRFLLDKQFSVNRINNWIAKAMGKDQ